MTATRLTILLLVIAAAIAVAVPTIRRGVRRMVGQAGAQAPLQIATFRAPVERAPNDAQLRLGFAEVAAGALSGSAQNWGERPTPKEAERAYEQAVEAAPEDPAPRMRHALFLLRHIDSVPPYDPEAETLTADRRERLRAVVQQMAEVRERAPQNAAADYLAAWALIPLGREDEALERLRAARDRSDFTLYQPEAARAGIRMMDHSSLPEGMQSMALSAVETGLSIAWTQKLRDLVRHVTAMGDDARHADRHQRAILCYESVIHLGRLMRSNSHDIMDGLLARAVTRGVASSDWTPDAEGCAATQEEADRRARRRTEGLLGYLRAQSRDGLADLYLAEIERATRFKQRAEPVPDLMMRRLVADISGGGTLLGALAVATFVMMLVAGVIAGLVWLATRGWRDPPSPLPWRALHVLAPLAALLLPSLVAGLIVTRGAADEGGSPLYALAMAAPVVGLILWAIAVWWLSASLRGTLPEAERPGALTAWWHGGRALICPTIGAAAIIAVLGMYPVQRNMERLEERTNEQLIRGEVAVYGLDAPPAEHEGD